jgi:hypothetical protein
LSGLLDGLPSVFGADADAAAPFDADAADAEAPGVDEAAEDELAPAAVGLVLGVSATSGLSFAADAGGVTSVALRSRVACGRAPA